MTSSHVNFFQLLLASLTVAAVLCTSDIGLPMIQINYDDDDEYPELQEQVHLDDFFWTGSGDGPPEYVKKIHTGISKGKDVIVKTNTVVATVFVEGQNEVDIPICLDCFPDNGFELPLNFSTNDRRYWLLTVISGFYSVKDTPMLEEKLAKLYRLAFTRQQSKHLGFGNGALSKRANTPPRDLKATPQENLKEKDFSADDYEGDDLDDYHETKHRRRRRKKRRRRRQVSTQNISEHKQRESTEINDDEHYDDSSLEQSIFNQDQMETSSVAAATEQSQLAFELLNTQTNNGTKEDLLLHHPNNKMPNAGVGGDGSSLAPPGLNAPGIFTDNQVRVVIHNVTQITEEDIQSGGLPSGIRAGADAGENINEKIDERPLANQTEIIYSVFVGGRPVMAVTAANDMKLVSELEVTSIMGKDIFMKAEPYLREPQATPLAPATRSSESGIIATIGHNALLIAILSIVILLFILLLLGLLLMGRPKRNFSSQSKRNSSRNELLAEKNSPLHEQVIGVPIIPRVKLNEGVHNLAYENETARTTIPAQVRSRRGSTTSDDNTSDSSVYTPINPPNADVQRILDEKAATLFDKRKRRPSQYEQSADNQESVYTKVVSDRKSDKKHSASSNTKHKTKRRYLSANRVGSLEDAPNHSSTETTASNESIVEALRPSYQNFERTEAYNPHNNYHRNKILQNRVFTDKVYDTVPNELPTQAINREIIRALQPSEKSSETGSIGSFLSMASVKSFPKNNLPEPLNRVLEPVFVTYYDNVDETISKPPRKHRSKSPFNEAAASIQGFPEPKAPRSMRATSQSDNPDPGVVGPVVWEIHKKRMASDNDDQDFSYDPSSSGPIRDPAETRSHYEGLLEGALQMYSSQDDLPTPLPTKNFTNQRKQTKREFRGKSAGSMDQPRSASGQRPSTAQPEKTSVSNNSTQPPSPNMGAWGSGGVHQPLVRPLSAGPFHRPPEPAMSVDGANIRAPHSASAHRDVLSAAPLIEAIQNELRKFKREN